VVLGKRGELGRVIACFAPDVLERLAPGDAIVVRGYGQGATIPGPVELCNIAPDALPLLPIRFADDRATVSVRAEVGSHVAGNGIGRPVHQWDLDLQFDAATAPADLRLGDLVAVSDLDVRHNAGYRRGFRTVGVIVHGASPQPGHGPGLMPILCGPSEAFDISVDSDHSGLTEAALLGGL
jgi:hypothetical protein